MSFNFVASYDNGTTGTGTQSFASWNVSTGEALLLLVAIGVSDTISNISDGTNTFNAQVGPTVTDASDGFRFLAFYNPSVTGVTGGTLTVTKSAGADCALIAVRMTGLDAVAAAQAGSGYARTASTVGGTDNCSAAAESATVQPAVLVSIGIEMQGNALTSGTGFTSDAAFANLPASAFGWQGRIQHELITDLSAHTATISDAASGHTVNMFAFMLQQAAAGAAPVIAWVT